MGMTHITSHGHDTRQIAWTQGYVTQTMHVNPHSNHTMHVDHTMNVNPHSNHMMHVDPHSNHLLSYNARWKYIEALRI